MGNIKKEYSNGDLTVIWQPHMCIHSEKCAKGLPEVFDPKARPWINPDKATTDNIKTQIDKCPSGALSYRVDRKGTNDAPVAVTESSQTEVQVIPGGPLIVLGTVTVKRKDGSSEIKENRCALCRCGASSNKPYCDGTHKTIEFDN